MKYIWLFICFAIPGVCFTSCNEKAVTVDSEIYIHLQGGFNDNDVKVSIDGNQVYHKQHITTNNLLGLADVDSTLQQNGDHSIRVDIDSTITYVQSFTLQNTIWCGINLNPNDSTVFIFSDEKFLYD